LKSHEEASFKQQQFINLHDMFVSEGLNQLELGGCERCTVYVQVLFYHTTAGHQQRAKVEMLALT
jgi:hypothetical protein